MALLVQFQVVRCFGQKTVATYCFGAGELCTACITLLPDGIYNKESGCEASSRFSFGHWQRVGDTLKFTPMDRAHYPLIKHIASRQKPDSFVTVRIFDRNGKNITSRVIAARQSDPGTGSFAMPLDGKRLSRRDRRQPGSVIILRPLQALFRQKIELHTDTANYFEVTLNITADWSFQTNSVWHEDGTFELIKTKQGLVSTIANVVTDKGPQKTIYTPVKTR